MTKVIKCESCKEKIEVDDGVFNRWMNDHQFFCDICKEELDIEDDLDLA